MRQALFTLEHVRRLTADTCELSLSGDTSAFTAPGQFVNIQLPGKFLRRPISVCDWAEGQPPAAGKGGGGGHPGTGADGAGDGA